MVNDVNIVACQTSQGIATSCTCVQIIVAGAAGDGVGIVTADDPFNADQLINIAANRNRLKGQISIDRIAADIACNI